MPDDFEDSTSDAVDAQMSLDDDGDGVLSLDEARAHLERLDQELADIGDEADRLKCYYIHTQLFFELESEPETVDLVALGLQALRVKHGLQRT